MFSLNSIDKLGNTQAASSSICSTQGSKNRKESATISSWFEPIQFWLLICISQFHDILIFEFIKYFLSNLWFIISATSPNCIFPLFLDHCTSAEYLFNVICAFIPASLSIQDHHTTTTSNKWRGVKVTRFSPRWVWGRIHCTFICTYNVQYENVYHDKILKKSMYCYIT